MSTIKSSSEDLTLNADGSNEVKFQINAVEKASINSSGLFTSTTIDATALTGNLPEIDGSSLTGLPAAGDKRNYIIDGDFTQWPEGTGPISPSANNDYTSALMQNSYSHDGTVTWERSTDTPTPAESSYSSKYSYLVKCTGTDATIGAPQSFRLKYNISGPDFQALDRQQVTLSFWAKTSAANSGHTYWLKFLNDIQTRHYVTSFTPTSSWTQFTHTLTLDTSGAWETDESKVGLRIEWTLAAGSNYDDATLDTWGDGAESWVNGSTMSNFLDSTSNEFYLTQVGLYLGSTAPTFTSPPIATVKNQVNYYVERVGAENGSDDAYCTAHCNSTTQAWGVISYDEKRVTPTVTQHSSDTTDFRVTHAGTTTYSSAITTASNQGTSAARLIVTVASGLTAGRAAHIFQSSTNSGIIVDARHY